MVEFASMPEGEAGAATPEREPAVNNDEDEQAILEEVYRERGCSG